MKELKHYITEKLVLNKSNAKQEYAYRPKDRIELRKIIEEKLKEDKDADLNDIDVSQITDMTELFYELDPHNIDISKWDVSNVEDMANMFLGCKNFDCDLSSWNVSKVTDMYCMFNGCKKFDCDLSSWNVSNVKSMAGMFYRCTSLKNIPRWHV